MYDYGKIYNIYIKEYPTPMINFLEEETKRINEQNKKLLLFLAHLNNVKYLLDQGVLK